MSSNPTKTSGDFFTHFSLNLSSNLCPIKRTMPSNVSNFYVYIPVAIPGVLSGGVMYDADDETEYNKHVRD